MSLILSFTAPTRQGIIFRAYCCTQSPQDCCLLFCDASVEGIGRLWRGSVVGASSVASGVIRLGGRAQDVLCAAFFVGCLLAYVRFVRQPSRLGFVAWNVVGILALMSKPAAVSLVPILPVVG